MARLTKDHRFLALPARLNGNGQRSFDRANLSVKRELSSHQTPPQSRHLGALRNRDHSHRNRKIEAWSFFPQVRRRQVDCCPRPRPTKATVGNCRRHAIFTLPHRGVGQTDQHDHRVARPGINFNLDLDRLDSLDGRGKNARQRSRMLPRSRSLCRTRVDVNSLKGASPRIGEVEWGDIGNFRGAESNWSIDYKESWILRKIYDESHCRRSVCNSIALARQQPGIWANA